MMAETDSSDGTQKQVQLMRDWINSQPHLPDDIEDRFLLRYLHSCYYDLEKAQTAAELFFTLRGSSPDLINDRDPLSPHMQKTLKMENIAQLQISGNRNLWIFQLNDPGMANFDAVQDAKVFILSTDAWMLNDDRLQDEDIVLIDAKDISLWRFFTKFNMSVARRMSRYQGEAVPIRLKQIHIANAPPFVDKLFAFMRPFVKQEIADMMHFHTPNSDTLHQYLAKDDLPQDFGGNLPNMDEQMKNVLDIIMRQRDRLLVDNLWAASAGSEKKQKKNEKDSKPEPEVPPLRTSDFNNLSIESID